LDLAQFAGQDYVDLTIDGKPYRVGELTLREWAPVQARLKANVPGPLSSLASPDFKALPSDIKRDVLAEALEQDRTSWPPRIGSKGWFVAMDNEGGHEVLLRALLGKHRPGITTEECAAIAGSATFEEILPAVLAGLGFFGPKSPAPAEAIKPTTTGPAGATATTSKTSRSSSPRRGAGRRKTSSA
jgi:hypothetical protein